MLSTQLAAVVTRRSRGILGFDTGFAKFGWGLITYDQTCVAFHSCGLIRTEKCERKQEVRTSSDNATRGVQLAKALADIVVGIQADNIVIDCIAVEAQSLVRNACVVVQLGAAFGLVYSLVAQLNVPLVEFSPQEIKTKIAGSKSATKSDVLAALKSHATWMEPLGQELKRQAGIKVGRKSLLPPDDWEHPVDATAAAVCALDSDIVRALRRR